MNRNKKIIYDDDNEEEEERMAKRKIKNISKNPKFQNDNYSSSEDDEFPSFFSFQNTRKNENKKKSSKNSLQKTKANNSEFDSEDETPSFFIINVPNVEGKKSINSKLQQNAQVSQINNFSYNKKKIDKKINKMRKNSHKKQTDSQLDNDQSLNSNSSHQSSTSNSNTKRIKILFSLDQRKPDNKPKNPQQTKPKKKQQKLIHDNISNENEMSD